MSSAFALYFIISCSAFCLLTYEMYCLTRVRQLFYFFSLHLPLQSCGVSQFFLHLPVWKARKPGTDGRARQAKKLLWQSREPGNGIRGRCRRRKSSRKQRSKMSSHHILSRCSHNMFSCYQHSQALFSYTFCLPSYAGRSFSSFS